MNISKDFNSDISNDNNRTHPNRVCVVCSASACGMNFNATTCQSCKAFFRRNALKPPHALRCTKNRSCGINISSRRVCAFCRLQKCLAAGMNRQLIQTSKQIPLKRQKRVYSIQINPFPSLLIDQDHLILDQIRYAYKTRTRYFHPVDILPELYLSNDYFFDFSTLSDFINARSITIIRLILFFKSASSQFQFLNTDDKVALIKFNISSLFWLNISLFYNPITNTFCEDEQYDLILDGKCFLQFYGFDIYNRIRKYLYFLYEIIQIDPIIIYLLILNLLFSHFSSCISLAEPILQDYRHIRQSQYFYTRLLVRILIEKFGEQNAYILQTKLIFICLNIQNLSRDISTIESTQIFNENIFSIMKVFLIR